MFDNVGAKLAADRIAAEAVGCGRRRCRQCVTVLVVDDGARLSG